MPRLLTPVATLVALLLSAHLAGAQSTPPLPPSIIVNGSLLTGSNGSYSTNNYGGNGVSASLSVASDATITFGAATGYWVEPYLLTAGYWTTGYTIAGHTIPGYWSDGFTDGDGNWNQGTWHDDVWVPDQWVDGYWVDEVWTTRNWVPQGISGTGAYAHFTFQMSGSDTAHPADAEGNAWTTTPQFGIPAVQVGDNLWPFNAADTAATYDYFTNSTGDGWLWITAAHYGGYDPQAGAFSGDNSHGYFRDTSNSSVRLIPRNGDGSFLRFGVPAYGPPTIWNNGFAYRFLTTDTTNAVDVYLEDMDGYVFIQASGALAGLATGSYASPSFQPLAAPTFALDYNGAPLVAGSAPHWGPPAVYVIDATWRYRGSTATADYYGGERPGQVLSVGANGAVYYSDRSLNFDRASGLYTGGVFQNLPVIVRSVTAAGAPWTAMPSTYASSPLVHPTAVTVDGHPWYYSSTQSNSGHQTYLGAQSGQTLTLTGTTAVLTDPTTSTHLTGTFANGKFTFAGSSLAVSRANADGTPADTGVGTANQAGNLNVAGNLDVAGHLTLGSWTNAGGESVNGFALSFTSGTTGHPASLLQFDAPRYQTDWVWTRLGAAGATTPQAAMKVDANNILTLYSTDTADNPPTTIILNPSGRSRFDKPVRIAPQGDISMGPFTYDPDAAP